MCGCRVRFRRDYVGLNEDSLCAIKLRLEHIKRLGNESSTIGRLAIIDEAHISHLSDFTIHFLKKNLLITKCFSFHGAHVFVVNLDSFFHGSRGTASIYSGSVIIDCQVLELEGCC